MKPPAYRDTLKIVLGHLYFQKFDGNTGFFGLTDILTAIGYPTAKEELNNIGKYLEAKDYIKAIFQIDDVYVQIITQGILYVEELLEKNEINEIIIKEMNKKIKQSAQLASEIERPSIGQIKARRKQLLNMLTNIKRKLGSSINLENYDLKKDVDIIKLELEKLNPDKDIIRQKMMRFDYNERIRSEINVLYENLNIY